MKPDDLLQTPDATVETATVPDFLSDSDERLLWVDLEMTGLSPINDIILEVAAIVTDWNLTPIAQFESGVGHDSKLVEKLLDANPFYVAHKDNKRKLLELSALSPGPAVVERELVAFVREHTRAKVKPVVLCGNSIHQDRQFIRASWPLLEQQLHYRMLDVTAWKIVFEGKYDVSYKKAETHRALSDIEESIAELRFYMTQLSPKAL